MSTHILHCGKKLYMKGTVSAISFWNLSPTELAVEHSYQDDRSTAEQKAFESPATIAVLLRMSRINHDTWSTIKSKSLLQVKPGARMQGIG